MIEGNAASIESEFNDGGVLMPVLCFRGRRYILSVETVEALVAGGSKILDQLGRSNEAQGCETKTAKRTKDC